MWVTLFLGNGLLMCLYSQEWYAVQNCPRTSVSREAKMNFRSKADLLQATDLSCNLSSSKRNSCRSFLHMCHTRSRKWYFAILCRRKSGTYYFCNLKPPRATTKCFARLCCRSWSTFYSLWQLELLGKGWQYEQHSLCNLMKRNNVVRQVSQVCCSYFRARLCCTLT